MFNVFILCFPFSKTMIISNAKSVKNIPFYIWIKLVQDNHFL